MREGARRGWGKNENVMINNIREAKKERGRALVLKKYYADILLSPVMHTDCTNAKMNGRNVLPMCSGT